MRSAFYRAWGLGLIRASTASLPEIPEGLPWVDTEHLYNVVYLDLYSAPMKGIPVSPPTIFRISVNNYLPLTVPVRAPEPTPWREASVHQVNTQIEVTCQPDELMVLADWLPAWLAWRLDHNLRIPPPPECAAELSHWTEPSYVYYWTPRADAAYESYVQRHWRKRGVRHAP